MRLTLWMVLMLTGFQCCISQSPPSFDFSLWSDFIESQIQISLITGLTSLRHSLDVLGTQLITRFASCCSNCDDVEWNDGTLIAEIFLELPPPCGVINIGILQGNYTNHPISLSWHIPHVHTAVINLTVEELTFPMSTILCDNNHVRIDGISVRQRKLCGKQMKQIYYSKGNIFITLFAGMLVHNSKLCLSYSHGWYHEMDISDKDVHMASFKEYSHYERFRLFENNPAYIQLSQVGTVMRKFLLGADFMNDIVIEIRVFTGLSSIQMYDGLGKMSPLMRKAPHYSNITSLIWFYLYVEVTVLSYDEEGYIAYKNVLDGHHVTRSESSHTHYELHFVDLKFKEATSDLSIKSERYTNTWHKVRITGNALTLQLNDFSFNGPFVQFLRNDFYTCQFGGLFLRAESYSTAAHNIPEQTHMSICNDDISPGSVLVLGAHVIYVYVLYLVGYSEGSTTLTVTNKAHVKAHILQGCNENEDPCILHNDIWNETGIVYLHSRSDIKLVSSMNLDLFTFFLINPPIGSHPPRKQYILHIQSVTCYSRITHNSYYTGCSSHFYSYY